MQPFKLLCIREETLELRIDFFRALRLAFPNEIIPCFRETKKNWPKSVLSLYNNKPLDYNGITPVVGVYS